LKRLKDLEDGAVLPSEDGGEDRVVDDEHIVHRSAESGQFVTEKTADESPATTVEERIDAPRATGDVHYPFKVETPADSEPIEEGPDPTQAAEPVDAGVGTPETNEEGSSLALDVEPPVQLSEEEAKAKYEAALAEAKASEAQKENNGE
jgi:hypothetical protein